MYSLNVNYNVISQIRSRKQNAIRHELTPRWKTVVKRELRLIKLYSSFTSDEVKIVVDSVKIICFEGKQSVKLHFKLYEDT